MPLASKEEVAEAILDRVEALRAGGSGRRAERAAPTLRCVADRRRRQLYTLYRQGVELLEDGELRRGDGAAAEVARRAPEKTSVREALGRAYFRNRQFAEAAAEFEAVVERHPVNDYAHFCLGRALSLTGERERARHHLALASNLRPERRDYRLYRDRLRARPSAA